MPEDMQTICQGDGIGLLIQPNGICVPLDAWDFYWLWESFDDAEYEGHRLVWIDVEVDD